MTTTPNEFLQFAKDMGLNQVNSTPLPASNNNNNGYTLTGLSVLNNLCHLIEQMHTLKAENDRLRARLELTNHVEKFLLNNQDNNKLINQKEKKYLRSTTSIHGGEGGYDEDKSFTLSPSSSLKIKKRLSPTLSMTSRERQGVDFIISHEDSSSMLHVEYDQREVADSNLGPSTSPNWNNWNKLRRALSFTRRRKQHSSTSPVLNHTERTIPAISISFESEDDRLHNNNKRQMKKNKIRTSNDSRIRDLNNEDTDQDDECLEFNRTQHERKIYRNDTGNSANLPISSTIIDDDSSSSHKQSKIAHYRHKLYSKLHTVKKQFSDQNPSLLLRPLSTTHSSTFDDIGSGLNHALLTTKLASAMTKSYQQKMREWQTMQKSNFLVNYRRQSIVNKSESSTNSRKTSVNSAMNESSNELSAPSIEKSNPEIETNSLTLSPTLSPNQRSLILHQWREIMSEEILLRHYNEYLQRKMQELKQLEIDLKTLKTSIFCTNNPKHHSMTSIEQLDQDLLEQHRHTDLPQRCRSFQSLRSMPASWIVAVQSAAYSDILDGTSKKTTERAIIFNKKFFNQLKHFKDERQHFQQDTIKDFQLLENSKTDILYEEKRSIRPRKKIILTRACLRKFSFTSINEIPQPFQCNPILPLQTTVSKLETSSYIDLLSTPITNEQEASLPSSSSSTTLNKRSKRSRFDFKKTLQRSKSMCMTQFNSWLQRRRQQQQQHLSVPRRKSATDPKTNKDLKSSPSSTPKLLGSPRLARIHQRLFKPHPFPISSSSSHIELPPEPVVELPLSSSSLLDDSDEQFQKAEDPVRIYLPARTPPNIRHVRITDVNMTTDNNIKTPPMSKIVSPIITRRNLTSSITTTTTTTTARERRESFAAQSKSS